jgi:hypothetical protein
LALSVDSSGRLFQIYCRREAYAAMKAEDVSKTLDLALTKSGLGQINVAHRQ